ncbi:hypothetical protein BKA62DRAFT_780213 [Auriculariales sp. MPI-PUGE-AT-0066]|nr:hypothetical protein BKA62DRAFT_780213 [Auriculariales sp. MPI-PUGE-AT-0066]
MEYRQTVAEYPCATDSTLEAATLFKREATVAADIISYKKLPGFLQSDSCALDAVLSNPIECFLECVWRVVRVKEGCDADFAQGRQFFGDVKPTTKSRKAACTASAVGSWKDITLKGEDDEDGVAVFDECGEIRRKIRLLLKEPDFKCVCFFGLCDPLAEGPLETSTATLTAALDPRKGRENGTYYAAYKYFEKRRILEKKKKTAKRESNEAEYWPKWNPTARCPALANGTVLPPVTTTNE